MGRAEGGLHLRRFDACLIRRPFAPLPRRGWTWAPRHSTRFLEALLEMLEGMPACHNSPQRLERVSLWHFVGERGMTFFRKLGKNAISIFLREPQKMACVGIGGRPRGIRTHHRHVKEKFCVSEVPWSRRAELDRAHKLTTN